jgi:hypothetical protein
VHRITKASLALVAATLAPPAGAELDVPVAARVLAFLSPPPQGPLPVAILVEPGNAASESDAAAIERAVGAGLAAGRATIRTRRVPVAALGGLSGFRAAFVTLGTRAQHAAIAAAAARASVVTITSDGACVAAHQCVVGIADVPRVQITVSKAAAKATNARFGSAFLMLVKEV